MRRAKLGRKLSTETKRKMSASHKGKKHTTETKSKISASKKIAKIKNPWD